MIRQIAPKFFTTDMQGTLDYYRDKNAAALYGEYVFRLIADR